MKIIIAGAGAVGMYLARMLSHYMHDIIVIDKNPEKLNEVENHYDVLTIEGDSTLLSVLKEAQVSRCDLLISVTSDQNVNILTSILGKNLGAAKTIARIDDAELLLPAAQELYHRVGVDTMIYPERIAALEILDLIKETASTESFHFADGQLCLLQIVISKDSPLIGKSLNELSSKLKTLDFRAVAIKRDNRTIIPRGKDVLMLHDHVYVLTKKESMKNMLEFSGIHEFLIQDIMILGGTKIALKAASLLEDRYNVKIIEKDKDRCYELTEHLNQALVIHGSGNDLDLLHREGLGSMDAFLALTESSEVNIFTSLLAKNAGVKKTITLVDDVDFIDISQHIGIDAIINKKLITAGYIHQFTMDAEISASKCLSGVDADVIEFIAKENSRIVYKKLNELKLPQGVLVGGIIRDDEAIIATGELEIKPGDHTIIFTLPHLIPQVEKYFK